MKLNITYGEDGLYHVRVFAKPDAEGRRPSKRISGPTRKDVQQQALAWQQEMEQQNRSFYKMPLSEAAQKYLEYLSQKKKPLSPSTKRLYDSYAKLYFQNLHDISIFNITEEMIQAEIFELESKLSAKTIINIVNFYVPCIHHFRRGFHPDLELPEKEEATIQVPDMEYLKNKIATIDNKRLLLPVLLAAYCGMRRSEIAALDLHNDVEYDVPLRINGTQTSGGFIHINRALVRGIEEYEIKGTKTKAGTRTVFLPGWLNDIVKQYRDDPEYVPYPPHKISSRFAEWAEREDICCSFHGLRHFYASLGEALNIPDLYMMSMMGHSTSNMLDKYKEIMADKQREVNESLFVYLNNNSPFAPQNAPQEIMNEE